MCPFGIGGIMLGSDYVPAAAPSSFNPLSLNPTLWLNGRNGISTSGSNVTEWADQSGSGNNYSTSSNYPTIGSINSNAALSFNSSDGQFLANNTSSAFISTTAFTMFAVWQYTGNINLGATYYVLPSILSFGTFVPNQIGAALDGSATTQVYALTGVLTSGESLPIVSALGGTNSAYDPHQSYHAYDGTNIYVSIDGGTISITSASPALYSDSIEGDIGAGSESTNQRWSGTIGEIFVCNTYLNATQISNMQTYLNSKWAL